MIRTLCMAMAIAVLALTGLGCDQDNAKDDAAAPAEDTVIPSKDTIIPSEDTMAPPEDTVLPPPEDTIDPPLEDTIDPPPEDTVAPPEDTALPPEDTVLPPEDTVDPPEDTIPHEDSVEPPEDTIEPPPCVEQGEMGSNMMTPMACCEGLDAISVASWNPDFPEMCGMMSDVFLCSKCPNGHCDAEWENPCNCVADCPMPEPVGAQALCAETGGTWTSCGSGCGPWACGEPYPEICPAVCVPQCECADGGWDSEKGCVACTCDEWFETWATVLVQVQACQSPADCVDVPGTSCGCTMNYVVNASASLWLFWQVGEAMGNAGCSPFVSFCSCPAADGFKCEDNTCSWNYL